MSSALKTYTYDSGVSGPNLLVTGAVHGNETCGPKAIGRLMNEFNQTSDEMHLTSGKLTLVPVCNRAAYKAGRRHLNGDWNRNLDFITDPKTVEDLARNQLCAEIRQSDVL